MDWKTTYRVPRIYQEAQTRIEEPGGITRNLKELPFTVRCPSHKEFVGILQCVDPIDIETVTERIRKLPSIGQENKSGMSCDWRIYIVAHSACRIPLRSSYTTYVLSE